MECYIKDNFTYNVDVFPDQRIVQDIHIISQLLTSDPEKRLRYNYMNFFLI